MRRLVLIGLALGVGLVALAAAAFFVLDPFDDGAPSGDVVSLWPEVPPAHVDVVSDADPVELGTAFTSKVEGDVAGVRFWWTPRNEGPHTASLWSPDGERLATVDFEQAGGQEGWRTAWFDQPVEISEGERYVVSYHAPRGHFAQTVGFSGQSYTGALAVEPGESGVYADGESAFPTKSWESSQYWVDPLFVPREEVPEADAPALPKIVDTDDFRAEGFPTSTNTGVPKDWEPQQTFTGDVDIDEPGAVLEDVRIVNGVLHVRAPDVTIRRVEFVGSRIDNLQASSCNNDLVIEDSSFVRGDTELFQPAVQFGGYRATRVKVIGLSEGLRAGGRPNGCGPVVIEDSYVSIAPADGCPDVDWHGDGFQAYDAAAVTIRDTTILLNHDEGCLGNGAIFHPNDAGNERLTVENVLVAGGGFPFRLGTPGEVSGLKVVADSWEYGPTTITSCGATRWGSGNEAVTVSKDGAVASVGALSCR
ncbi:DUF4082 domain-containing protein [Aeromicrobium sp. JJY06]|uniref:DUF4082 domain-containing protein n=1 Tax=Aeromicrobium sp. JJY06 TaxID=3373478 RepID=UPI00376EFEDF